MIGDVIQHGSWLIRKEFIRHSGGLAHFKVECDHLTDEEIATFAYLIHEKIPNIGRLVPVPSGGNRIAEALQRYSVPAYHTPSLIVEDAASTGASMEEYEDSHNGVGVVLFWIGEKEVPCWIRPVFSLWV